ncbi:MAG: Chk1 protein kinase [Thelocarpon impressellum]|nr:MAG: Chk1 protein kinase [Thelocarpon impressellum]
MQSQLDPLPDDLPFRIVSKTIGRGAYASIKKAIPPDRPTPVFAVKFIHKAYAVRHGRISAKQINMEVTLHSHVGQHQNVIEYYATGEDTVWRWIAMEFAQGGDLFDKIEADVGVSEDVGHLYFRQLVGAVAWMHSRGVGHRDIKPENMLLSASGDLKLADFGLATLFSYKGTRKASSTMCGSPPYIAPEVINCAAKTQGKSTYNADQVDVWSCGVVLFVLLVGNTPWDEPTAASWEYDEYVRSGGRPDGDELWSRLPNAVLSLLRGMMRVEPAGRFTFEEVRRHPWFTRANSLLGGDGKAASPVSLATKMLENLKIDFSQEPTASQPDTAMDVDNTSSAPRLASTQPETPINDVLFDWERPPRMVAHDRWTSASQPTTNNLTSGVASSTSPWDLDPSMSQFSAAPSVPLSLTQRAQRFQDIVPAHSLTRFLSHLSPSLLLPLLSEALHRLGVPAPSFPPAALDDPDATAWVKIKTVDGRQCGLSGDIVVERAGVGNHGTTFDVDDAEELLQVRFVKVKGDPLEWRRFFKKVVVLCKEGVYLPGNEEQGGVGF